MRERRRPAFFENLVYGFALVLALIVAFYAAQRVFAPRGPAPEVRTRPVESAPGGEKRELVSSGIERAVRSLPPVRITKAGASRTRPTAVPSPPKGD